MVEAQVSLPSMAISRLVYSSFRSTPLWLWSYMSSTIAPDVYWSRFTLADTAGWYPSSQENKSRASYKLHRAAYAGHAEVVELLLHTRAVQAQDGDGQTPLYKAELQGHKNVVLDVCPDACTVSYNQVYGTLLSALLMGVILGDN